MSRIRPLLSFFKLHASAAAGSYSIIFFSMNRVLAILLLLASFVHPVSGVVGLSAVLFINLLAALAGLPERKIRQGLYGFNALLVALALASLFQIGTSFFLLLPVALIITLIFTVWLDGRLSRFNLPFLSLPFLFALWLVLLAWIFESQTINRSILVSLVPADYPVLKGFFATLEDGISRTFPEMVLYFFKGFSSIFFSGSVLTGALIALGILIFSRIAFLLSVLGFVSAYYYYQFTGLPVDGTNIMQFGFNYILTAIAVGGFFYIPSLGSFLLSIILVPVLSLLFSASAQILFSFGLAPYSLPFNIIVIMILYVMMFREKHFNWLRPALVQTFSPENNLYGHQNDEFRFGKFVLPMSLPVMGPWKITQGHNGAETHRDEYKHAWDFQYADGNDSVFQGAGQHLKDYYSYEKPVYAPADGVAEDIVSDIPDNAVGEINQAHNWGNTVVIKHTPYLFSKLSHLKENSIPLKKGDVVKKGDLIGFVGNSGRSPFPHLHFQLQSTAYIGSRTLEFPLSSYYIQNGLKTDFVEQGIPEQGQTVVALLPDVLLRRIFHLVPGMDLHLVTELKNGQYEKTIWHVMSDMSNQYYIKCSKTNAVAYFTIRNDVFYFLSYYGKRKALLYKFYTGFHKIITGIEKTATTHDRIPINMGKFRAFLWIQDFLAPFFRFVTFSYSVHSEKNSEDPLLEKILIDTVASQRAVGITLWEMKSSMMVLPDSSIEIHFKEKKSIIKVQCSVTYGY